MWRLMPTASSRARSQTSFPSRAPVKLDLVINLKAAKELQLEVPLSLFIRADELIE
jgi:hypothetical protein